MELILQGYWTDQSPWRHSRARKDKDVILRLINLRTKEEYCINQESYSDTRITLKVTKDSWPSDGWPQLSGDSWQHLVGAGQQSQKWPQCHHTDYPGGRWPWRQIPCIWKITMQQSSIQVKKLKKKLEDPWWEHSWLSKVTSKINCMLAMLTFGSYPSQSYRIKDTVTNIWETIIFISSSSR